MLITFLFAFVFCTLVDWINYKLGTIFYPSYAASLIIYSVLGIVISVVNKSPIETLGSILGILLSQVFIKEVLLKELVIKQLIK